MVHLQDTDTCLRVTMKSGQQDHFLKLYEPIHDRFERFCRARVYGEMDYRELMSESILIAFEKMHTLRSEQAFLSFLFGISVRILSNQRRKKKVVTFQDESLIQKVEDNRNRPDEDADVYFLHQVLTLLPVVQKESLILFEIAGFNIREIAGIQQASESAVKQRLKRGRQKLAEILHNESNTKTKEVTHGEA